MHCYTGALMTPHWYTILIYTIYLYHPFTVIILSGCRRQYLVLYWDYLGWCLETDQSRDLCLQLNTLRFSVGDSLLHSTKGPNIIYDLIWDSNTCIRQQLPILSTFNKILILLSLYVCMHVCLLFICILISSHDDTECWAHAKHVD